MKSDLLSLRNSFSSVPSLLALATLVWAGFACIPNAACAGLKRKAAASRGDTTALGKTSLEEHSVVLPRASAAIDGANGSGLLFEVIRLQHVYAATGFPSGPILIRQLRFRPSAVSGFAFSTVVSNFQINMSTTPRGPGSLVAEFAQNTGSDDTLAFQGPLAISSVFSGPAQGPKDFDIVVSLHTPFHYDPAAGNLLIDYRNFSGSGASPIDASGAAQDGASRAFALNANATSAGTIDTGAEVIQIVYSPSTNSPPPPPPPPTTNGLVMPVAAASEEGGSGSGLLRQVIRLQHVYAATGFPSGPILIQELRFRPSATYGQSFSTVISNLQINMSTTTRQPEPLSSTFAENSGADNTMVFQGSIAISSSFTGPAQGPKQRFRRR